MYCIALKNVCIFGKDVLTGSIDLKDWLTLVYPESVLERDLLNVIYETS